MRENEDHTRPFMPLMRRVIILAAVVAAVPVVMWTATGVVRNYLGLPSATPIQTMTAAPVAVAPDQVAAAPTDNPPAPAEDAKAAQAPAAPPMNAASNAPTGIGSGGSPTITITSSVAPVTNTAAAPPPPKPAAPASSKMAMSNPAASPPANSTAVAAPVASAPTPNDIWPAPPPPPAPVTSVPPMAPAPPMAAPAPMASASLEPPVEPSADALPQSGALAGRVPLPRKRPPSFIIAQGGIPLPRPRPITLASNADERPSPFEWLRNLFQPPASAATTGPSQNVAH
jgi:hypothetical protein